MCRFGIPQSIVTNNEPQFDSRVYMSFCSELKIKNLYLTPRYPQSNGQAEASNKTLLLDLKKRPAIRQREMGRRTTRGIMGLQNNQLETNWHIAILLHVWDGRYHPHGNRDAYYTSRTS